MQLKQRLKRKIKVIYIPRNLQVWAEKDRGSQDERYKWNDKKAETRDLIELERGGERTEPEENRISWQSWRRAREKEADLKETARAREGKREREGGRKERGDRFACSAACPACPCAVGGMLHVELTARIYILLARIFISVRGRLTSSMTGGRDARCLVWLCLTAFLRTSLRRATTAWRDTRAKGTRVCDA